VKDDTANAAEGVLKLTQKEIKEIASTIVTIVLYKKGYGDQISAKMVKKSSSDYLLQNKIQISPQNSQKLNRAIKNLIQKKELGIVRILTQFLHKIRSNLRKYPSPETKADFVLSEIKKITDRRCHQRVDKLYCELPIRKKIFERMSKKPFLQRKQDVMEVFKKKFDKGNEGLEAEVSLRTLTKKPLTKAFLGILTGNLKGMVKGSRDDLKELIGQQNDVIFFF
jgi:hypothetical protein